VVSLWFPATATGFAAAAADVPEDWSYGMVGDHIINTFRQLRVAKNPISNE
jgi:hypothetical protein